MITTHILDLSTGKPAGGVRVALSRMDDAKPTVVGSGITDADGRLRDLVPKAATRNAGVFELTFETGPYFRSHGIEPFHPHVTIVVEITDPAQNYHIPLLISPFGYTTYRGS